MTVFRRFLRELSCTFSQQTSFPLRRLQARSSSLCPVLFLKSLSQTCLYQTHFMEFNCRYATVLCCEILQKQRRKCVQTGQQENQLLPVCLHFSLLCLHTSSWVISSLHKFSSYPFKVPFARQAQASDMGGQHEEGGVDPESSPVPVQWTLHWGLLWYTMGHPLPEEHSHPHHISLHWRCIHQSYLLFFIRYTSSFKLY